MDTTTSRTPNIQYVHGDYTAIVGTVMSTACRPEREKGWYSLSLHDRRDLQSTWRTLGGKSRAGVTTLFQPDPADALATDVFRGLARYAISAMPGAGGREVLRFESRRAAALAAATVLAKVLASRGVR